MRGIVFSLALLLCLCANAYGETVRIGNADIAYSLPAGFAKADGLFPMDLRDLDEEFGMKTVVFATFIPEADVEPRQNDSRAVPSWYAHMAYDAIFSKISLGNTGFVTTVWMVGNVIAKQYANPDFVGKLENVIAGALNRKLTILSMTHKGVVEDRPRYRSMLAYGLGELEGDNGMEPVALATMSTFFLEQGKLIVIIQACRIDPEDDLSAFTGKALRIAGEISGRGASRTP